MSLLRFLRLPAPAPLSSPGQSGASAVETQTVRRIVAQLEAMPPERARFLAGFAYILGRVAESDMHVSDEETAVMERLVAEKGGLDEAQAVLVVGIAKRQAELYGATEDYLVTRDFAAASTDDERLALLRLCFEVAAADGGISSEESSTLTEIGQELGLEGRQITAIRTEFADQLTAMKMLRRAEQD